MPYDNTETVIAVRIFLTSQEPRQSKEWIEGVNWDNEKSNVMQDIRELSQKVSPLSDEFDIEMAKLKARLADYSSREEIPGHYERKNVLNKDGSVMTVGEYFYSLRPDGKREFLKDYDIRAEMATPDDLGASRGLHVIINGRDHGVWHCQRISPMCSKPVTA